MDTAREGIGEKSLTEFEKQLINSIQKISKKCRNISVKIEQLKYLRKIGFTCKNLLIIYKRTEQTIYRWFKLEDKQLQKRSYVNLNLMRKY